MSEKGKRIQLLTYYLPYIFITIAADTRNRGIGSNAVDRIWPKISNFIKINQELVYLFTDTAYNVRDLLNQFTHAYMMLYDIFINSSCVINVAYFYMLFLPKVNIYFVKYFLIDAQLAGFLHYDAAKLN